MLLFWFAFILPGLMDLDPLQMERLVFVMAQHEKLCVDLSHPAFVPSVAAKSSSHAFVSVANFSSTFPINVRFFFHHSPELN